MEEALNFLFMTDWGRFITGAFATSGFISHAVAITPTKKDDQAVSIIGSILNIFAGNYGAARNQK